MNGTCIAIGCDIARLGKDKTVLSTAWLVNGIGGKAVTHLTFSKHQGNDTMVTAGIIAKLRLDTGCQSVRIDADGLGAGVYDRLRELGEPVVELRGGRAATDPTRFVNARSEWLWNLRTCLRPDSETPLALPDDPALLYQLTTLRWSIDSGGRIAAEKKADWAARCGRSSPDELDSIAYCLAPQAKASGFFFG